MLSGLLPCPRLCAGVACVSGLFGMNMPNGFEDSHWTFPTVCLSSASVAVFLWFAFAWFSVRRGLISGLEFGGKN